MPAETLGPIRRTLCPTDFSPTSGPAFDYAERLAACSGASLLALYVQPGWGGTNDVDDEMTREPSRFQPLASEVDIERLVLGGSPGEAVCWVAQERKCDQIVMGTHGRTGLASVLMGSVAEYVVRNARSPSPDSQLKRQCT